MPNTPLHIIFLGTSAFAVPSLEALAKDKRFSVDLVITQPDRPTGRKQILTPPPIKISAEKLGLPLQQPEKINTFNYPLSTIHFLVVVSYGQILSQAILDLPTKAPVNVHASLLPRWRGASPIQNAILAGDRETGVTIQRMVKQLDAGPILAQANTPIDPRETTPSLHDRLAVMGAELLIDTLTKPLREQEQDENEIVFCHKLTREDGNVDPNTQTAEEIDRKARALNPWPGVTMEIGGQQVKILETALADQPNSFPFPCRGGSMLHLVKVQRPGGKPVSGAEWGRNRT
jgi:methionyl-tRNA formyltransferase